jgi:hypothetical protein
MDAVARSSEGFIAVEQPLKLHVGFHGVCFRLTAKAVRGLYAPLSTEGPATGFFDGPRSGGQVCHLGPKTTEAFPCFNR